MILRYLRRIPPGLAGLLIAAILAASLALLVFPHSYMSRALAATTCAEAPSQQNCDNQDPIAQGCVTDAQVVTDFPIRFVNNLVVGDVQLRYSPKCQSYWGRVFDERQGATSDLILVVGTRQALSAPPTFANDQFRILYSPMVFAGPNGQSPQIQGIIKADGADVFPSATIPPGQQ